jgi:hypothetical protein
VVQKWQEGNCIKRAEHLFTLSVPILTMLMQRLTQKWVFWELKFGFAMVRFTEREISLLT